MKEKIEEATASLEQLRNISLSSSEIILTDLMAGNFMAGMSQEDRFTLHDKVIRALEELGISSDQIKAADNKWRKGVGVIYHREISSRVEGRPTPNTINNQASENQKQAYSELRDLLDFSTWSAPSPNQIRKILSKHDIANNDIEELLNDYDHYLKTSEMRNPELLHRSDKNR